MRQVKAGQRLAVSLFISPSHSVEIGTLTELELTTSPLEFVWTVNSSIQKSPHSNSGSQTSFYSGTKDPASGSHAYPTSTLPNKPSPQPYELNL